LLNDKITVRVAQDDYLPSFEKTLKEYGRKANIPGFRKGMVPTSVIRKMYGKSVFADEVIRSVEKSLSQYLSSEKLDIFAQPLPLPDNDAGQIDMSQPREYSFAFEVGLKPLFDLPRLDGLGLVRYQIEVSEAMIDEEVERLRHRYGHALELESVDSPEVRLQLSFIELSGEGQPREGGLHKDLTLPLSYFQAAYRDNWNGLKKGEGQELRLSEAFEEKEAEWVAKELGLQESDAVEPEKSFRAQIKQITKTEKAEPGPEFYQAAYRNREIKDAEEFRQAVREDIQRYLDEQSRNQLQHTLYHELLDQTKIEFPESFLKRWLQQGGKQPKSPEEVEHEFPSFENQLKWSLIVDRIARENQIEVQSEDIRQQARKQLLGYMGLQKQTEDQAWVDDYVNRVLQDKKFVDETASRIQSEKIFAWAESQAHPVEKPITVEAFNAMQQEHESHHH